MSVMAHRILIIILLCCYFLSACKNEPRDAASFRTIGVVYVSENKKATMETIDSTLGIGTDISILCLQAEQISCVSSGRIISNPSFDMSIQSVFFDDDKEWACYQVETNSSSDVQITDLAIAIIGDTDKIVVTKDGSLADLDGDGANEYVHTCTSKEGVHLSLWSGRPFDGLRIWHAYYYLGYDVEETCTREDYQ